MLSLLERIDLKQNTINIDSVLDININNIYEYVSDLSINSLPTILSTLQNNLNNLQDNLHTKQDLININSDLSINATNIYYNNDTIIQYINNQKKYESIIIEGEGGTYPVFSSGFGIPIDEEFGIPFYKKGVIENISILIVNDISLNNYNMKFSVNIKNTLGITFYIQNNENVKRIQHKETLNLNMNNDYNEIYINAEQKGTNTSTNIRYRINLSISYQLEENISNILLPNIYNSQTFLLNI